MPTLNLSAAARSILEAQSGDPFAYLGMHMAGGRVCVRVFLPWARRLWVLRRDSGEVAGELPRIDPAGLFAGPVSEPPRFRYRLRAEGDYGSVEFDDIYSFPPVLGDIDVHLLGEGRHQAAYNALGAHCRTIDGVAGVAFAVWAPNAKRVSVIGEFNDWDGRRCPMRLRHGVGIWEIFVPGLGDGHLYKYELLGPGGELLPYKADPYAAAAERPPGTASRVVGPSRHDWRDQDWINERWRRNDRAAPISIYEVHLGSWRRKPEEGHRWLSYRELADELVPYAKEMGFTHLELLPVTEFPFDGSWGYQPIGLFAPTGRFGMPDDFRFFVDQCHAAGLGLLLDWVPGHFPTDAHGLARFDGTALYEHADPRQGFQPDWNTFVYNFGRAEVTNFLIASALSWIENFHADGLRVDAVASMLYLDYSRKAGEWIPNRFGGRENIEAIDFLRRTNELIFGLDSGATTAAEESTAWPMVSRPTYVGGL
ncbi:MAG: 1,4-alpha-glucan branching enzyme, partial [Stellaceae bacterium]